MITKVTTALTATIAASVAVCGGALAAAPAPATPASAAPATNARACTPGLTMSTKTRAGTVEGAAFRVAIATFTAKCPGMKGVAAFHDAVNTRTNAELATWKRDWHTAQTQYPSPIPGSYERALHIIVNTRGLTAVAAEGYSYLGGAHGTNFTEYQMVNTLSGALITQKSMLAEMQAAGGPNWNFERELNRAVGAALPGEQYATITRQAISSYPSKDGLRVAVDQCAAYACAAGVVNATIPWDRLIAPDADMSFLPNQWGH